MIDYEILAGDAREQMRELPAACARVLFSSPPYWGQRDYDADGQIGLEASPDEYVSAIAETMRSARHPLAEDGLAFLNLGDGYASRSRRNYAATSAYRHGHDNFREWERVVGMPAPHKSLIGVPGLVGRALIKDGWILRAAIVWHKPNARPHPAVTDRPQSNYEFVLMLARSEFYLYDASRHPQGSSSIWSVPVEASEHGHPAPFPPDLPEIAVLCATEPGDLVLDPFCGSGSTGVAALRNGRRFLGIDLHPGFVREADQRLSGVTARLFA